MLIKGGHATSGATPSSALDYLFTDAGLEVFEAEYIPTTATHGTGCTLAAAITAGLAQGSSLRDAVSAAKAFVTEAIRTAPGLGGGHSPINVSRR